MFRRSTRTARRRPDIAAVVAGLRAAADDLEAGVPLAVDLHHDGELLDENLLAGYASLRELESRPDREHTEG
ncbi:hypothetical protein [Kitasatospora sp. NPDC047058]|uniref:hypothetical protein n=1 Tax=Kitasatospora sp. NPDC047058 TaxID=3155620 RepID=UPI00340442F3